jgi:hypothetical protein
LGDATKTWLSAQASPPSGHVALLDMRLETIDRTAMCRSMVPSAGAGRFARGVL